MDINWVYMTAGSKEEARSIGRELVESKLAACVNIIDGMSSIYWWEDTIQEDTEVILIAKTRESLVPKLTEMVRRLHSYDCPCIVSLPVSGGNPAFLDWIVENVKATA